MKTGRPRNYVLLFFAAMAPLLVLSTSRWDSDDFYEVLGVDRDASKDVVKGAYRKLALKWHPDKHPDKQKSAEKRFRKIAEAYEVLSNDESREQYDNYGTTGEESDDGSHFEGSFEDFLRDSGFEFNFHEPDEVLEKALQDLDVSTIFATIFDENNEPVQPEDLEENSAITELREAANLGINFAFEHVKTGADGATHKLVFRSDGSGSFSAYAEPFDGESGEWIQMQGDEDEAEMDGMEMMF